jgi:hypothetical protein
VTATDYIAFAAMAMAGTLFALFIFAISDGEEGWPFVYFLIPSIILYSLGMVLL